VSRPVTEIVIGVSATKSSWSQDLRKYVRDHTQGIAVEVIMDPGRLLRPGDRRGFDVVLLDDLMRLFGAPELAAAQDSGAVVIGLFDEKSGMGREFLARLGANRLVPTSTPPSQLVEMIREVGPSPVIMARPPSLSRALSRSKPQRGWISAWTKVSGGAGLTETVVAVAEALSPGRRVLLIEAEEIGPILASRLRRSAESGLALALNRISRGQPAFPEALSLGLDDGSKRQCPEDRGSTIPFNW
jgi:DNA-binding NarL/FixJ family response regulator